MKGRRDSRNRILQMGESQRADGSYAFRYTDNDGKRRAVYCWKLVKNDPLPKGKKDTGVLREKEKEILKNLYDGVGRGAGDITVYELARKYISTKTGVRETTKAGYGTVLNLLMEDPFGSKTIDRIRLSDAKVWLIKLQQKDGKSYSSIHSVRGVLRPAFQMAVDDDLLRKNPFEFELASVVVNDSARRTAISRKDERRFLEFVKTSNHYKQYYEGMFILFNTGMRISEFVGLTVKDIDLENRTINIDHQLLRTGKKTYIQETKTNAGTRVLPMTDEVCECFRKILKKRKHLKVEPMIDGYSGFLYFDKDDKPMLSLHWEKYFKHAVDRYNQIYKLQLTEITPHICRHTYCTNMAKAGMNPKALQYLMGHSDISITLNVYTHMKLDDAKEEMYKIFSQQDRSRKISQLNAR